MLVLPVGDIQKRKTVPFFNYLLIFANIAVYFWVYLLSQPNEASYIINTGVLVPKDWSLKTLFTSMFLHQWEPFHWHLIGNMLFLWTAGNSVEDRLGHLPYLLFYFLCGLAGAATHVYMATHVMTSMADTPTLGASGAVSGVVGAYFVFFPKSKIKMMIWLIIFVRYFTLPSWGVIGFWIAGQLIMAREQLRGLKEGQQMQVAVFAHLGGFVFGLGWAALVRLFGKKSPRPAAD